MIIELNKTNKNSLGNIYLEKYLQMFNTWNFFFFETVKYT